MKKTFVFVTMLLVVGILVCLPLICAVGCTQTNTSTVTDANGLVTTTVDNMAVDIDENDIGAIVNLSSQVWDIVSNIINSLNTDNSAKAIMVKTTKGDTITKSDVLKKASEISLLCFRESGKLPTAEDIAAYIRAGTMPSEAALTRFADTGRLIE